MLEYWNKELRIQDPHVLVMLLFYMKFVARGSTEDEVSCRWRVVQQCLRTLIDDLALRVKIVSYVTTQWMCDTWRYANHCIHTGCLVLVISTANWINILAEFERSLGSHR